ncbi:MAG: VWA domain-containing protein [Immundisolibacterales bacterium]|nr:VWA domain-containing protein [Immundisolibacterales bacterium]
MVASKSNTGRSPATTGNRDTPGIASKLLRFASGTRAGATAISAAALTVMTLGGTALVVEQVWLADQRDMLKSATDAATIAATVTLGRELNNDPAISDEDLKAIIEPVARRFVILNLTHLPKERYDRAISTLVLEVVVHRAQRSVDVVARADLGGSLIARHLPMLRTAGMTDDVQVASRTESFVNPVEVVLAIDVSASMWELLNGISSCTDDEVARGCDPARGRENSRIAIVKRAAKNLVNILDPSAENRVAIGVVPWHTFVRLEPDAITRWERNNWARYPTRRVYPEPYVCKGSGCATPASIEETLAPTAPESWKGCLDSHRVGSVGTNASLPATSEFFVTPSERAFAKAFFPAGQGAAYECMTPPLPADFGWNICYHGRRYGTYSTDSFDPFKPQHGCSDANPAMLPLSTDAQAIDEAIDALEPVGNRTYSALGLLWGQRVLDHAWNRVWGSGDHPADPAASESEGIRKAIVLLTDGEDSHCGLGNQSCSSSELGFSRADACTSIKQAGTEIFVVAAMRPDRISSALGDSLRACSSETANSDASYAFLDNTTREQLEAAFADIATRLQTPRRVF